MANIWRNMSGRLAARSGARLGARLYSSTSRVADPAPAKLTFIKGVCGMVVSFYAGSVLSNYWFGLDRIRAESEALDMELERSRLKASVAFDEKLERIEKAPFGLNEKLEREFQEWKARRLTAESVPRDTEMKDEQLARARKD